MIGICNLYALAAGGKRDDLILGARREHMWLLKQRS